MTPKENEEKRDAKSKGLISGGVVVAIVAVVLHLLVDGTEFNAAGNVEVNPLFTFLMLAGVVMAVAGIVGLFRDGTKPKS